MTTTTRVGTDKGFLDLYRRILAEVPDQSATIDIGAGLEAPWQYALQKRCSELTLLDAHQVYLDANRTRGTNVSRVGGEVPGALRQFATGGYDVALAIDFIEHLDAVAAGETIREMKRIARKVVIFTPKGNSPQDNDAYQLGADHWQTHRSVWERETLERYGFTVGVMDDFHGLGQHALFGVWRR